MSNIDNIGDDYDYQAIYESYLYSKLDGQEYQPSPHVVADTQEGYDGDGNWHCVDVAGQDTAYSDMTMPYKLAVSLNAEVVRQVEMNDYTVGIHERHDIAMNIANEWLEQNAFDPADLALEALNHWRRMYMRGRDG
jgi:hypothetical protein